MTPPAETSWHRSACILCENNCGIQIQRDGRRYVKIRGDKDHVTTAGYTCTKALRLDHYQNGNSARAAGKTPAVHTSDEFPFILAAGQRRAFTANTVIRDATWRLRERDGTLRLNPGDAERLGLPDGATVQITASRGTARATVEADDRLQPGHAALPNGFGLDLPADGGTERTGVALNTLTDQYWRDPIAATPWHKHVPARIEAVTA
jgi:anaerobic selenocysteine-containing dehydrogenase